MSKRPVSTSKPFAINGEILADGRTHVGEKNFTELNREGMHYVRVRRYSSNGKPYDTPMLMNVWKKI